MNKPHYIIDFDSTFVQVESLDELAAISLRNHPNGKEILSQIQEITTRGMIGEIGFDEALNQRVSMLNATTAHLQELITLLRSKVTSSFSRNRKFINKYADQIHIISGGFKEYIIPIVSEFGIPEKNVHANTFILSDDKIVGYDQENLLAHKGGKIKLIKQLNLNGEVHVIGDGYTDYEIKEAGVANHFYLFTENVKRAELIDQSEYVINSLDEFLFMNQLVRSQNYPKSRIKVLILENIHPLATTLFRQEQFDVKSIPSALEEEDLIKEIKDIHVLCIRSKTQVTEKVLAAANKLIAIGAFCIGTNQIDEKNATLKGIPVFNAPYSNTRSVVELTIAEIIMLMRNIPVKNEQMHRGVWDKSVGHASEVRGKILGIIGYGNIGSQLSIIAEAMGMKVCFYDISDKLALGNARRFNSLKEVLNVSDVVSLHVDGRVENTDLINEESIQWMKKGAVLINNARGHVVSISALTKALDEKKLVGAALDVFDYEPVNNDEPFHHPLVNHQQVILTPHIGGSTAQAQEHIGAFVPDKIKNFINNGDTYGSVNFPQVQLPQFNNAHRLLHVHQNKPGILAQINSIFAEYKVNILSQYLQTNQEIGYVITDIDVNYSEEMIEALKQINATIKLRMLY